MRHIFATSPAVRAALRVLHVLVWSALLLTGLSHAWAASPPAAPSGLRVNSYPTPTSVQLYWEGSGLNKFCTIAENEEEFKSNIKFLYTTPYITEDRLKREQLLNLYDNEKNAKKIVDLIWT